MFCTVINNWSPFKTQCFWLKWVMDPGRDRRYFVLSISFSQRNWIPFRNLCKELTSSFLGQNRWMRKSETAPEHQNSSSSQVGILGILPKNMVSGHELPFHECCRLGGQWRWPVLALCRSQFHSGHWDTWQLKFLQTWKPNRSSRTRY